MAKAIATASVSFQQEPSTECLSWQVDEETLFDSDTFEFKACVVLWFVELLNCIRIRNSICQNKLGYLTTSRCWSSRRRRSSSYDANGWFVGIRRWRVSRKGTPWTIGRATFTSNTENRHKSPRHIQRFHKNKTIGVTSPSPETGKIETTHNTNSFAKQNPILLINASFFFWTREAENPHPQASYSPF